MPSPEEEIERLLKQDQLTQSDVVSLMADTRVLLEAGNLRAFYPRLNFYCNWMVHSGLSGSALCYEFLVGATRALVDHDRGKHANDSIAELVGLDVLRKEFLKLYRVKALPTRLFESKRYWFGFCSLLLRKLEERPIEFPSPEQVANRPGIKDFRDAIIAITPDVRLQAQHFWFSRDEENEDGSVYWNVRTESVNFRGKLMMTEPLSAFECP